MEDNYIKTEEEKQRFRAWLAGFIDGEGCFHLNVIKPSGKWAIQHHASFEITVRRDDTPILEEIRAVLGCGHIKCYNAKKLRGNEKPVSRFIVSNVDDLLSKVIPIFDQFPLRAKKKRDFPIWVEGVELINSIKHIKQKAMIGENGGFVGIVTKWTDDRNQQFTEICKRLAEVRKYK